MTEEELFEIKQKFLREIPHPKLIQKQINHLNEKRTDEVLLENPIDESKDILSFFNNYIRILLALKLKIANAKDDNELYGFLKELYQLQLTLIKYLSDLLPEKIDFDDRNIKQSDPFDIYVYVKELKDQNVKENDINDYLCGQFELEPVRYSELAKAVLRARKIVAYDK